MAVIKNKWVEKLKNRSQKTPPASEAASLVPRSFKSSKENTTSSKAMHKTLSGLRK